MMAVRSQRASRNQVFRISCEKIVIAEGVFSETYFSTIILYNNVIK